MMLLTYYLEHNSGFLGSYVNHLEEFLLYIGSYDGGSVAPVIIF